MATGSGLFKPIITGTVARTTTKENSGFGFGVYYWSINLGAFLAPLWVSYIKGFSWRYVFLSSAAWCFLMLLPTLFIYKDPERPESTKPVRQVLKEALLVLSNSRFMLLIIVYSCFWILYFQMFGSILWYLRDFINRTPVNDFMQTVFFLKPFTFDAEFVTIKLKALPVMATGIIIGSGGFLVLAFTRSAWMFILGIAVFSLGEMTAHPKYYSYVGSVAPQDKKAVYMGYAFLYGVFGSLIGSNLGAVLYEKILNPLVPDAEDLSSGVPLSAEAIGQLKFFWLIFAVLGVACLFGMLLYNKFFAEDTPKTNQRAWKIMLGLYIVFALVGIYFVVSSLFISDQIQWKTLIQGLILLALGGGGVRISLRRKE
jgi:dipeptide/tripeptide permease